MPAPKRVPPRRALLLMIAVLLLQALWPVGTMAQAVDRRCFSETNQCIEGRFREFWEQHGGLAVFGYPITPARLEQNRDTGQTIVTQWFERNRFELHPQNQPPYDVLLGRLGDDRLRQLGVDWQSLPGANDRPADCLYFEQTRKTVCDVSPGLGFKSYWTAHGLEDPSLEPFRQSLALFGLPLSLPRLETNAAGDTVLTQWFERARFEWHPHKPDQYKVLLGLLGNEVRNGLSAGGVVTTPADKIIVQLTDLPPGFRVIRERWLDERGVSYERTYTDPARLTTGIYQVTSIAGVFPGDQNLSAVTFATIAYDAAVESLTKQLGVSPEPIEGIGERAVRFVKDVPSTGATVRTTTVVFRRLNVVGNVLTAALVQTNDPAAAAHYARIMASRAVP